MGVGEDIRTLKEAIMVGRRHGVRGGKHWWRSYERRNVTTHTVEKKNKNLILVFFKAEVSQTGGTRNNKTKKDKKREVVLKRTHPNLSAKCGSTPTLE